VLCKAGIADGHHERTLCSEREVPAVTHAMFGAHLVGSGVIDDLVDRAQEAIAAAFDPDRLAHLEAHGAALRLPSAVAATRRGATGSHFTWQAVASGLR
jgi:hypothetical protein